MKVRLTRRTFSEAISTWQWANFWASRCPPGKTVVHVNMDETSIPLWQNPGRGLVRIPEGKSRKAVLESEQRATLAKRRCYMSLLCFLSDDEEVQKKLPQVLVVNEKTISVVMRNALEEELAFREDFFLLRRKSAWTDAAFLGQVLRLVAGCLAPFAASRHLLFAMDCSPVHATTSVAQAAARGGLHLHYIPAKMTGVMQPLDVYFFGPFKHSLRRAYGEKCLQSESGEVDALELCRLVMNTLPELLHRRSWRHAFRGCGYGGNQAEIGERLRRRLEWPNGPPPVSRELPSLAQLESVWISGKRLPIGWLFHLANPRDGAPVAYETAEAAAGELRGPWFGRLRSSSSLAQDESSASASASRWPLVPLPPAPPPLPPPPMPPPRATRLGPPLQGHPVPQALPKSTPSTTPA